MSENRRGIWLEVTEAQWEGGTTRKCRVLFKADRSYPKPIWWPVSEQALQSDSAKNGLETYKAIVFELDKKRVVLGRLGCHDGDSPAPPAANNGVESQPVNNKDDAHDLECVALRFQSPELGSR